MILTYIIIKLPNRTSEAFESMLEWEAIPKEGLPFKLNGIRLFARKSDTKVVDGKVRAMVYADLCTLNGETNEQAMVRYKRRPAGEVQRPSL